MVPSEEKPTAQVLDFVEFQQRRALARRLKAAGPRRFLWGWPSSSQLTVVEFPDSARGASLARFHTL